MNDDGNIPSFPNTKGDEFRDFIATSVAKKIRSGEIAIDFLWDHQGEGGEADALCTIGGRSARLHHLPVLTIVISGS